MQGGTRRPVFLVVFGFVVVPRWVTLGVGKQRFVIGTVGKRGRPRARPKSDLAWGGNKVRLAQVAAIDRAVWVLMDLYRDDNPVAILAGDFSTTPAATPTGT